MENLHDEARGGGNKNKCIEFINDLGADYVARFLLKELIRCKDAEPIVSREFTTRLLAANNYEPDPHELTQAVSRIQQALRTLTLLGIAEVTQPNGGCYKAYKLGSVEPFFDLFPNTGKDPKHNPTKEFFEYAKNLAPAKLNKLVVNLLMVQSINLDPNFGNNMSFSSNGPNGLVNNTYREHIKLGDVE